MCASFMFSDSTDGMNTSKSVPIGVRPTCTNTPGSVGERTCRGNHQTKNPRKTPLFQCLSKSQYPKKTTIITGPDMVDKPLC